jgi:hypothetical protein
MNLKKSLAWCGDQLLRINAAVAHRPVIRRRYNGKQLLSAEEANEKIGKALESKVPFMAGRYGSCELAALWRVRDSGKGTEGSIAKATEQLHFNAGFFPMEKDAVIQFAEEMKSVCTNISEPREGKKVYIGTTYREVHDDQTGDFTVRIVYEITERTTDKNGQIFLIPQIEVNTYWTSLGVSDEDVIELYHNHAICEQYHSELKSDMNVERLPSGKFETNSLILMLAMIAYNINRIIGVEIMKGKDAPVRHSPCRIHSHFTFLPLLNSLSR